MRVFDPGRQAKSTPGLAVDVGQQCFRNPRHKILDGRDVVKQWLQAPVGGIQIAQARKDRCPPADERHRPVKGPGG